MESWLLRNVGFYRSFLPFYVLKYWIPIILLLLKWEWPSVKHVCTLEEFLYNHAIVSFARLPYISILFPILGDQTDNLVKRTIIFYLLNFD